MTNDPAKVAANKVLGPEIDLVSPPDAPRHYAEAAANAALDPIREWWGRIWTTYEGSDDHESRVIRGMLLEMSIYLGFLKP